MDEAARRSLQPQRRPSLIQFCRLGQVKLGKKSLAGPLWTTSHPRTDDWVNLFAAAVRVPTKLDRTLAQIIIISRPKMRT